MKKEYIKRIVPDWTILETLDEKQLRFAIALMQRMEYKEKQINNINTLLDMIGDTINETLVPNQK